MERVQTRVLPVSAESPEAQPIADAARVLAFGGLVAFPTETVYGLGAHALDAAAIDRLFAAKGRPSTDPLIVHLRDAEDLEAVARHIPEAARTLAGRFWPGPLTLIVEKKASVPDSVTAGLPTVGVRVPAHPVAQALLRAASIPVAAPSANRFSRPSPTRAEHVLQDLDGAIDLVLDGGATLVGVESTIVDLTVMPPVVRRPGGVTLESLRELLPEIDVAVSVARQDGPQAAPGQLLRHYAPRARMTLYAGEPSRVAERIAGDARRLSAGGARVGILALDEDLAAMAPALAAVAAAGRVSVSSYGARRDPPRAARELFAALRLIDDGQPDVILAAAPDASGLGLAIVDRLTRAAEGRVVHV